MNQLNTYSNFSGLKPNKTNCETDKTNVAPCGMKCVNLNNLSNLGVHFMYNKNFEQDRTFCEHIIKKENILKNMVHEAQEEELEGRIRVFKSLPFFKLIHILLTTKLHNNTIDLLYKIQKNAKIEGENANICNGYEKGGMKNDLRNKI